MRRSFYVTSFGIFVGVLWRSLFFVNTFSLMALLVGAVLVFLVSLLVGFHKKYLYVLLFCLVIVLGVIRTEFEYRSFENGLLHEENAVISEEGHIIFEPDERDDYTVLVIRIKNNSGETNVRTTVPQHKDYYYGERVHIEGEVSIPKEFETDTGRTFNYAGYLMKDSIHYQIKNAHVVGKDIFEGNSVVGFLFSLKQKWLQAVERLLPEPSASLAGGVIVGAKQSLGEEWLIRFRETGIVHIVVLSGYNLTLIANSIVRSTAFLPRTASLIFGTLGVIGFASMVGAGATVVRASVMAILGMLAAFVNRPYTLLRALILAGLCMVLWNPFVLVYDPGFQLSFMATAGLIFLSTRFEKWFTWVPQVFGLRGIVGATLATQLAVLPLLMYQMGQVSIVAPVVNVLVLPVVPFVMLVGFVAGIFEMLGIFLALPFAWIAHIMLAYIFEVVAIFSSLSFDAVLVPKVPWWGIIVMYLFLFILFIPKQKTTHGAE